MTLNYCLCGNYICYPRASLPWLPSCPRASLPWLPSFPCAHLLCLPSCPRARPSLPSCPHACPSLPSCPCACLFHLPQLSSCPPSPLLPSSQAELLLTSSAAAVTDVLHGRCFLWRVSQHLCVGLHVFPGQASGEVSSRGCAP